MAGYNLNGTIINQQLGDSVQRVRDGLETLVRIHELAARSVGTGTNGGDALVTKYGMTEADAADLRAVAAQFEKLSRVAHAQVATDFDDFFFEANARMILALQ